MMRERSFYQVDVFTRQPYLGNPLAVVLNAEGLSDDQMQRFAAWTNLSETTFVFPPQSPQADYRVRIFTPRGELPFAGHPTLGTCHAWLQAGGAPHRSRWVTQECGVGLVRIALNKDSMAFAAPALKRSGVMSDDEIAKSCDALNVSLDMVIHGQWVDNGAGWSVIMLRNVHEVLSVTPVGERMKGLKIGVCAWDENTPDTLEVRALVGTDQGFQEDPVTGSLNAGIASWLFSSHLRTAPYEARQGRMRARDGRMRLYVDADRQAWVQGTCVTCIQGSVKL